MEYFILKGNFKKKSISFFYLRKKTNKFHIVLAGHSKNLQNITKNDIKWLTQKNGSIIIVYRGDCIEDKISCFRNRNGNTTMVMGREEKNNIPGNHGSF